MSYSWKDASEQVAGLIYQGRQKADLFQPEHFVYPYNELVQKIKDGAEKDRLLVEFTPTIIQGIVEAAKSLNGLGKSSDWPKILRDAYLKHNTAAKLQKMVKKLEKGDDIDAAEGHEILNNLVIHKGVGTPLDEIIAQDVPLRKTGYAPIDVYVGGIPEAGVITLAGDAGVGKTSMACGLAAAHVKTYDTKVQFFTLEMIQSEFARRAFEINRDLTKEQKHRILVYDDVLDVNNLCAVASTETNVGLIVIDFIDQLIVGAADEPQTTLVYKTLAAFSKRMKVPILLLVPFSYSYTGGIPRPNHMRYTKMASHYSWMILMLYAPTRDYYAEEEPGKRKKAVGTQTLAVVPGKGYILCWKVRGGFRKRPGPLAIQVCWSGETGWGKKNHAYFNLEKGSRDDDEEGDDDE